MKRSTKRAIVREIKTHAARIFITTMLTAVAALTLIWSMPK